MQTHPFATTTTIPDPDFIRDALPPTDRQISYLRSLLTDEARLSGMAEDEVLGYVETLLQNGSRKPEWTKQNVSMLIGAKKAAVEALRASRTAPAYGTDAPEGVHYVNGTVYKVQESRTGGRRYVKRLRPEHVREIGRAHV